MIDDVVLTEEAEEGGWDVGDQQEVAKFLKAKVRFLVFWFSSRSLVKLSRVADNYPVFSFA